MSFVVVCDNCGNQAKLIHSFTDGLNHAMYQIEGVFHPALTWDGPTYPKFGEQINHRCPGCKKAMVNALEERKVKA